MKKKFALLSVLVLALLLPAFRVKAESLPTKDEMKEIYFTYYPASGEGEEKVYFPKGTKFSDFKTSSKNVSLSVTTEKSNGKKYTYLVVHAKKAGNSKIWFTATLKNKSIRYKSTVSARKYQNPIKRLKIGKKNYASCFKDFDKKKYIGGGLTGKLNVKASKGFNISGMSIIKETEDCYSIDVMNGQKIDLKQGEALMIVYYNKKYDNYGTIQIAPAYAQ